MNINQINSTITLTQINSLNKFLVFTEFDLNFYLNYILSPELTRRVFFTRETNRSEAEVSQEREARL